MGLDKHEEKLRLTQLDDAYIYSKTYTFLAFANIKEILKIFKDLLYGVSNFQKKGSGWYFISVKKLEIHTSKFIPTKGSLYLPLPDFISRKKAIINIQNKDDKCFMWSILRYLHPRGINQHPKRLTDLKQYENDLNFKNITFPVKLTDISKFEKQNPPILQITVYKLNKKK